MPADTPVTTPVPVPTVATPVALLVQTPPGAAFVIVIVLPVHTPVGPEFADKAFAVNVAVA